MTNRTHSLTEQLLRVAREEYTLADADARETISVAQIATAAQRRLDPADASPPLVAWAATLELRELVRRVCRDIGSPAEAVERNEQGEMEFDSRLQKRYPTLRAGDEGYTLRERLTLSERRKMATKLRKTGAAFIAHGDAFDAETDALEAAGAFDAEQTHS